MMRSRAIIKPCGKTARRATWVHRPVEKPPAEKVIRVGPELTPTKGMKMGLMTITDETIIREIQLVDDVKRAAQRAVDAKA